MPRLHRESSVVTSPAGPATQRTSPALQALLGGIIDYAGLFPPSSLAMAEAVRNYAAYVSGSDSWLLGRFVVPVARLEEFERETRGLLPTEQGASPWRLSALTGPDIEADVARIRAFNEMHGSPERDGAAIIDAVELKAASVAEVERALEHVPRSIEAFVEIPLAGDVNALVAAIGTGGGRAKARTGGTTVEAFPPTRDVARFLETCVRAGVPFKATAGLHHPLRAEYRLTYEPDAPTGVMYGFLNVFLAAALLATGMPAAEVPALLEETSADALRVDDSGISWRGYCLTTDQAAAARASLALSFGSCSFREPIEDLKALRLL
jgi:hypothetical protein